MDHEGLSPTSRPHAAPRLRLIVGVTGASGALYGQHLLQALVENVEGESDLILSPAALRVYAEEQGVQVERPEDYLDDILQNIPQARRRHSFVLQDHRNIGARSASGSHIADGMAIVPCSMKSLAAIAGGCSSNLIERAADVCLKERRRLVAVPRESPYNRAHLQNMLALTDAGGIILPASPAFYQRPQSLDDLGRFIAARILALFGVRLQLFKAWDGGCDGSRDGN